MAPEKQSADAIAAPVPQDTEGDSDKEENEDGWEDAEPDHEEETPVLCLFCPETFPTPTKLFEHCESAHQFDFKNTRKALGRLCGFNCMQAGVVADWGRFGLLRYH